MPKGASEPPPRRAESIYVHGADRLGTSAVAVGLAFRRVPTFAWADCVDPALSVSLPSRAWVERRAGRPVVDRVDPPLLRPANLERVLLRHVVTPSAPADEGRLLEHLAMPELFQRLASRAVSLEDGGVVVLANVDALPAVLRVNTVENARLHRTLHEEGLTVIVTSRVPPSDGALREFDRVFRVDVPASVSWLAGSLTEEKGGDHPDGSATDSLTKAWERLGLDPSLLAPP